MGATKQLPAVAVRRARLEDAAAITDLCGQLGYPSTAAAVEERLRQVLPREDHALYVAELTGGPVAGWVYVFGHPLVESDARAEVAGLVVDAAQRGSGIGRLLMRQAEGWAREKGYRTVSLRSNVIRVQAHAFYESLGYTSPKTQKAFRKNL